MAKNARAGDLRTKITVWEHAPFGGPVEVDADGYPVGGRANPVGRALWCKWVNAYGAEVYAARQVGVEEPATLTMRYTPFVTPTCLIYRGEDKRPYEVIGVNDVEDLHVWLEVKVKRKVAAK